MLSAKNFSCDKIKFLLINIHSKKSLSEICWITFQLKIFFFFFFADLAAIRKILENEAGVSCCPTCKIPFDKGKKRKLIDTCGHAKCYSCMFKNESCTICANTHRHHHLHHQEMHDTTNDGGKFYGWFFFIFNIQFIWSPSLKIIYAFEYDSEFKIIMQFLWHELNTRLPLIIGWNYCVLNFIFVRRS